MTHPTPPADRDLDASIVEHLPEVAERLDAASADDRWNDVNLDALGNPWYQVTVYLVDGDPFTYTAQLDPLAVVDTLADDPALYVVMSDGSFHVVPTARILRVHATPSTGPVPVEVAPTA